MVPPNARTSSLPLTLALWSPWISPSLLPWMTPWNLWAPSTVRPQAKRAATSRIWVALAPFPPISPLACPPRMSFFRRLVASAFADRCLGPWSHRSVEVCVSMVLVALLLLVTFIFSVFAAGQRWNHTHTPYSRGRACSSLLGIVHQWALTTPA